MKRLAVLGFCLALLGCATATLEEIAATQLEQDKATCATFGAAPGTSGYAACMVQAQSARRIEQEQRQAMAAAAAVPSAPAARPQSRAPVAGQMGCFKSGEAISGFNKICTYNCMGSARAETISSTSLCPLMLN